MARSPGASTRRSAGRPADVPLVVGLRVLHDFVERSGAVFLLEAFPDGHHHVAVRRRLLKDVLAGNAEPSQHFPREPRAVRSPRQRKVPAERAFSFPARDRAATGPILARGTAAQPFVFGTARTVTFTRRVRVRIRGRTFTRRVRVRVPSVRRVLGCGGGTTCESAVQQVTINPGGSTGWHTHPGATFVAVAQGEGVLYHAGTTSCASERYAAGSGFYQTEDDVHTLRNEGTSALVIFAFYILPPGTPNTAIRTDQPQPAGCPNVR